MPITAHTREAFAQLALLIFVFEPNAQTNNNTIFTSGIAASKMVTNHSPKLTSFKSELEVT